jgi:hypothetical protein
LADNVNLNTVATAGARRDGWPWLSHDRGTKTGSGSRMSVKQRFDLTGKAALVTGGSRGLGLQMAEALAEMGARLALVARKGEARRGRG